MRSRAARLLASVIVTVTHGWAQDAPPVADADPNAAIKGADVELMRTVRAVGERIASIVRLPARPEFIAVRADASVRVAEARARAERRLSPELAAARGRAWRDLGFGEVSDPADLLLALELDLAGMTFDAARARLLVDPSRLADVSGHGDANQDETTLLLATGVAPDESVAGHYMAHVLTDPAEPAGIPTTDATLARAALSEGGANAAALILLFGGVGLEAEVVAGKLWPDDVLGGRLVAPGLHASSGVIANLMQFVYLDGYAQVTALLRKAGFPALAADRRQRRTTRDIIHLDRPAAAAVELPAPPVPASAGLVAVARDSLGEEGVVVLVSLATGKDNLGMIAGDGWVADTVWRFEPAGAVQSGDSGATVWVSRWQTEEDAKDFAYAIGRCLESRFPGESPVESSEGIRTLARPDRVHRLELKGREVLYRVADPGTERRISGNAKKKTSQRPAANKN